MNLSRSVKLCNVRFELNSCTCLHRSLFSLADGREWSLLHSDTLTQIPSTFRLSFTLLNTQVAAVHEAFVCVACIGTFWIRSPLKVLRFWIRKHFLAHRSHLARKTTGVGAGTQWIFCKYNYSQGWVGNSYVPVFCEMLKELCVCHLWNVHFIAMSMSSVKWAFNYVHVIC
jgi:hypothetical protein